MTTLNRAMKTRAVRAIEGVHTAYNEVGGLKELEAQLDEKRAAAAKHVYGLAVFAHETTANRSKAVELFGDLCAYAEDSYKKQHNVENLAEALPTWRVFKSNVLTGMRDYDMDPREHRTEGAFRIAKQKLVADERGDEPDTSTPIRPKAGTLVATEDVDHLLATTITQDSLRTLVAQIVFELETLKRSKTSAAEAILRDTMNRLQPLVDARKVA